MSLETPSTAPTTVGRSPYVRSVGTALPLTIFAAALLPLATGRWGSYFHIPGVPVYIGDMLLAAAVVLFIMRIGLHRGLLRDLAAAPLALLMSIALLVWSILRFLPRTGLALVDLRDFAPYAYIVIALLAYWAPTPSSRGVRVAVFAALLFHAAWYLAATEGVIDARTTLQLGEPGTTLFSTRPDFDGAVFGLSIALVLYSLLFGPRPRSIVMWGTFGVLVAASAYAVMSQHSRAGLLATIAGAGAVLLTWLLGRRSQGTHAHSWLMRVGVLAAAVGAVVFVLVGTLPGKRLIGTAPDGLKDAGNGSGTLSARIDTYNGVGRWILEDPLVTTVGVGFGPDVLARSGTLDELEGETWDNVRSPHNWVLGSWARLGLVGALIAAAVLISGAWLGIRRLLEHPPMIDVVAALLVLILPVPAMLGVILESPFGAIPYFWAIGQLASSGRRFRRRVDLTTRSADSAGAQA